jgi:hypothetical protein
MKLPLVELEGLAPATISFTHPQPDWLPWHIARFHFFPRFAQPEKDFAREMKSLAEKLIPEGTAVQFDIGDPARCVVTCGGVRLIIDGAVGQFSLEATEQDAKQALIDISRGWDDPVGHPEDFFTAFDDPSFRFKPTYERDGQALQEIAERLWSSLQRRYLRAIQVGTAQVYGRWRQIDANFATVFPDQIIELQPDVTVIEAGGDYLPRSVLMKQGAPDVAVYAPHVAFSKSFERSKGTEKEQEATEALVAEMRASLRANPPERRRKADVAADYIRSFGISSTGFNERVWPDAVERVPECDWRKPGARTTKGIIRRPSPGE